MSERQELINELMNFVRTGIDNNDSQLLDNLYKFSCHLNIFRRRPIFQKFISDVRLKEQAISNLENILTHNFDLDKLNGIRELMYKENSKFATSGNTQ